MENENTKTRELEFADYIKNEYKNMRPLAEFIDYSRISVPKTLGSAKERISKNMVCFKGQYCIFLGVCALFLMFFNSFLLILGLIWVVFAYLSAKNIKYTIRGVEIHNPHFLAIAGALSFLLLVVMKKNFMFLCSMVVISNVLIFAHATLYNPNESDSPLDLEGI